MHRNANIGRTVRSLALLILVLSTGCTTIKMTGTARTGTEQLLLTGTWDSALAQVDFSSMSGTKVFLDSSHITVVDKDWIISSLRRTMAEQGLLLADSKDKAQIDRRSGHRGLRHRRARSQVWPSRFLPVAVASPRGQPCRAQARRLR